MCRRDDIKFEGAKDTLRKVLHDIGFVWTQRSALSKLINKKCVKTKRLKYLIDYMEILKEEKYAIVFQDETWIFQHGSHKTWEWQDGTPESCSVQSNANGKRYIISHVGGKNGFIPQAEFIYAEKKNPGPNDDYHGAMNGDIFKKYLTTQVLPYLEKPTVIVMDNAPYHSREVNSSVHLFSCIFQFIFLKKM